MAWMLSSFYTCMGKKADCLQGLALSLQMCKMYNLVQIFLHAYLLTLILWVVKLALLKTTSPVTDSWQNIKVTYSLPCTIPQFSNAQIVSHFMTRTAVYWLNVVILKQWTSQLWICFGVALLSNIRDQEQAIKPASTCKLQRIARVPCSYDPRPFQL